MCFPFRAVSVLWMEMDGIGLGSPGLRRADHLPILLAVASGNVRDYSRTRCFRG